MTESVEHKARMERLKTSVDRRIDAAQEERGLVMVFTGAGKGEDHRGARHGMALSWTWHEGGHRTVHQGGDRYG
jgi:cob(I)alamin adenosyltransferase